MGRGASWLTLCICLALTCLTLLPAGEGGTVGIEDRFLVGCGGGSCHGIATPALQFELEGVPAEYEADEVYTLNLSITGGPAVANAASRGQGGFDLFVTQGEFQLMGPDSGNLRLGRSDRELSHTANETTRRYWNFRWMAPESGSGDVEFQLAVLAGDANGDKAGDQWETQRIICEGSNFSWRAWALKGLGIAVVVAVLLYLRSMLKEADRAQREKLAREAEAGAEGEAGADGAEDGSTDIQDPLAPMPIDIGRDLGLAGKEAPSQKEPDDKTDDKTDVGSETEPEADEDEEQGTPSGPSEEQDEPEEPDTESTASPGKEG